LSFYQKGAWALFVLENEIGEKAFDKAVKRYLKKHSYESVNTQDFYAEIRKVSTYDLDKFSKVWLETTAFDTETANALLLKNKAMRLLFEIDKLKNIALSDKKEFFITTLKSDVYSFVKKAIIDQLKNEKWEDKKELLALALATNNAQVRQAVAGTLTKIPEDFRLQYESLLEDHSYQTQEIALYHLWNNFPEYRTLYLDKSKNWIGFNDYNLKTLWLTLALSSPDYATDKTVLIAKLVNYSSPFFGATTRQNALENLLAFGIINDTVLKNLVNATTHHMWQFSKFARDNIRTLVKNKNMQLSFERILPDLNEKEQFQLKRLIF
jgi:aminopeptidase N